MTNLLSFLRNILSLLASSVATRGANLILYALVSRFLGAHVFGQLMLALTWLYLGQVFAVGGMRTLVTREVSQDKSSTWHYFAYANVVVLLWSLVALVGIVVGAWLMDYSNDSSRVIVLISLSLLPFALGQVCEAVFQAWEEMQLIAIANLIGNVLKIGLAVVLLNGGAELLPVIYLLICSQVVVLLTDWYLLRRFIRRRTTELATDDASGPLGNLASAAWQFRWSELKTMIHAALPFLGIQSAIAIRSSLGLLVISKFANETQVGLYGAASQLMVPIALVLDNFVEAVFPIMCRRSRERATLRETTERMTELLLIIAMPVSVVLFITAEDLLLLVYGNRELVEAAVILKILACVPVLRAFTNVFGQVLWASQHEQTSFRITLVTAVVNLLATVVLIQYFHLVGVAFASLLTVCTGLLLHYVPTASILKGVDVRASAGKPLAASGIMLGLVFLLREQHPYVAVAGALFAYVVSVLLIIVLSAGGMQQVKQKYISMVSD